MKNNLCNFKNYPSLLKPDVRMSIICLKLQKCKQDFYDKTANSANKKKKKKCNAWVLKCLCAHNTYAWAAPLRPEKGSTHVCTHDVCCKVRVPITRSCFPGRPFPPHSAWAYTARALDNLYAYVHTYVHNINNDTCTAASCFTASLRSSRTTL